MEILAACHVHSEWSYDASWSLEALSTKFSRRGCRVLMMTEHDLGFSQSRLNEYREACRQASSEKILVVPGIEYSDASNRIHVLVWGDVPFLGEGLPTGKMLEAVHAAGGFAVLAHPFRRDAWLTFDPQWLRWLSAIEIWNRKYDGWSPSQVAPTLLNKVASIPFVGMDFHSNGQTFPLTMALDINADLTEGNVLRCLKSGRCSPRVFGYPLDHVLVRRALPMLKVAEWGRHKAAAFVRRLRKSIAGSRATAKKVVVRKSVQ
jgi:hypothetical protein